MAGARPAWSCPRPCAAHRASPLPARPIRARRRRARSTAKASTVACFLGSRRVRFPSLLPTTSQLAVNSASYALCVFCVSCPATSDSSRLATPPAPHHSPPPHEPPSRRSQPLRPGRGGSHTSLSRVIWHGGGPSASRRRPRHASIHGGTPDLVSPRLPRPTLSCAPDGEVDIQHELDERCDDRWV